VRVVKDNAFTPQLFPPRLLLSPRLVARAERQILVGLSRFLPRFSLRQGFHGRMSRCDSNGPALSRASQALSVCRHQVCSALPISDKASLRLQPKGCCLSAGQGRPPRRDREARCLFCWPFNSRRRLAAAARQAAGRNDAGGGGWPHRPGDEPIARRGSIEAAEARETPESCPSHLRFP